MKVAVAVAVEVLVGVAVGVRVGVGVRVSVGVWVDLPPGVFVRDGVSEGPAVEVGGGFSTAFSAAAASTIPLPQLDVVQLLPGGKERAVLCRIWRVCVKLSDGFKDAIRDMTPVICGAAMLVPW